ncbi:ferritin-like domain-containing protein [Mycena epipterygia]|nr:ferritin-like domain-containing protein [Mycena epipterygia]
MRYSSSILAALAAAPLLSSARPIRTRAASAADALVFQFANVLNQLESEFYTQGLAKFTDADFTAAGFTSSMIATQYYNAIQLDEATHISVLQQALTDNGATPLTCNFNFDSAMTDAATMAATARVVEYVGVAAFLGGATLIDDPVFLDAAASILTIEARHQTVLNIMSGTGSAIPQAFDIPLTPQEVLGIAGGFVDGPCDLGITATNPLTVTNSGPITTGTLVTVSGANITGTDGLFCNMMVGGAPFSINLPLSQCVVPPGINGPVALWITSDDNPLINNVVDRATTQQVAGPGIIFVDTSPEMIGALARGSSTSSSSGSGSSNSSSSSSDSSSGSSDSSSGSSTSSGSGNGAAAPAAPASTPLPTDFTGLSPDGKTNVDGVSLVPKPSSSASASADSAAAPSPSASSS